MEKVDWNMERLLNKIDQISFDEIFPAEILWEKCLESSPFLKPCKQKYDEFELSNDQEGKQIFFLISVTSSLSEQFEKNHEPYRPFQPKNDRNGNITWQSFSPNDLTEEQSQALKAIGRKITNPCLKARLLDVAILRDFDYMVVKEVVEAYLNWADRINIDEKSNRIPNCIERAIYYASRLGRTKELYQKTQRTLEKYCSEIINSSHPCEIRRICNIALRHPPENLSQFIGFLRKRKKRLKEIHDWTWSIELHKIILGFLHIEKNEAKIKLSIRELAELYEEQYQHFKNNKEYIRRALKALENTIQTYRKIDRTKDKRNILQEELRELQKLALEQVEWEDFSYEVDIRDSLKQAKESIIKNSFEETLLSFAYCLFPTIKFSEKIENMENKNSGLMNLFSVQIPDNEGRPIARINSGDFEESTPEDRKLFNCFELYAKQQWGLSGYYAYCLLGEIHEKFATSPSSFYFLIADHPFIPWGHENLIWKGLYEGWNGDFQTALHLLVPQLENSLRHVLALRGFDSTVFKADLLQEDQTFGGLIERDDFKKIFGDDFSIQLKLLFTSKLGLRVLPRLEGILS